MAYYIAIDGVQQGPFPLHELTSKGLRGDTLVWKEGMSDWKRADAVPEVAALFAPQGPEDRSQIPQAPQVPPANPYQAVPNQQTPAANPYQAIPSPQPQGTLSYNTARPAPSNGFAIASLVLGIAAFPLVIFYCMGVIPALLAIIFGFIARGKVKRGEIEAGAGMALAGIILGFAYFALAALMAAILGIIIANTPH